MDEDYKRNVGKVMDYLLKKGCTKPTIREHKQCFTLLGDYLRMNGLIYSDDVAWDWMECVAQSLDMTSRSIYVGALGKLSDAYAGIEIRSFHYRASRKEDRLFGQHKQLVDDYCNWLQESGLAPTTAYHRRQAAVRFLLELQDRGVDFIADVAYEDLINILAACEELSYYAKTSYREKIKSLLVYLHSVNLVRYGFTLLVDAMTLKKGYCWNEVDPELLEGLRYAQSTSAESLPLDVYLEMIDGLANEHRECGYTCNIISSIMHFGKLLYLFMDINGLRYDPRVAWTWLESLETSLSYSDFSSCRRMIMLLRQSYEGIPHDLSRPFVFKKTLHDQLPSWCTSQVDAFLATKEAEGWKHSTIVMFRTCTCRFCLFLDGIGIRDFSEVTVEHIKLFNVRDQHRTPEGKNAFNSRIRQFLEWLGFADELSNPNLYLALPNTSAPKTTEVVTLTPEEQLELGRVLETDTGTTLRDKAMLQLGLRMGIRASDVVSLRAGNIDWNGATIRLVQEKTGYEIHLPMPVEVANAIYRYVVTERPVSDKQSIFLRSKAPFVAVGANTAQQSLHKALPGRQAPGSGFHALRKTFASNMLATGARPDQVAQALGHRDLANVRKYLSLDAERMRLCAISLQESELAMEGRFGR